MVRVIGIPYDNNSSFLKGPAMAPPRIRLMDTDGSANTFAENGLDVKEGKVYKHESDIIFEDASPEKAFETIRKKIKQLLTEGDPIISLGGDHSVTYPIIDAFTEVHPSLHILHLDAHADLYNNFDNNPFSHASPFARIMEQGKVQSLTQVGIRTFNTHQKEQANKFGVTVHEMKDFNFKFINQLAAPLYISLDLDVLDPAFAPGVSHHEPGGLSTRELLHIIQQINVPIVGADIVEYNPTRDINNTTAMVAYKLMKELISKMAVN
ncbi:MAG: agmatinase [Chitinophagaceae bacterium]